MQFIREVRDEMRQVEWPDRKKLFSDSGTVFSTIILFAIFFFATDSIITWLLGLLFNL